MNQYKSTTVRLNKNELLSLKQDKKLFLSTIMLDLLLTVLFIYKWLPSGIVSNIASKIHLSSIEMLIFLGVILAIFSFYGIYKLLYFFVDYVIHFKKMKLIIWLSNSSIDRKGKICFSVILSLVFWLSQATLPIYIDDDNYAISMVLNQRYSVDNYCNFVSPILSYLVKLINMILPTADGYVLITELIITFAMCLLAYSLLSVCKKKQNVILVWLVLILINYTINIYHSNFTIYSAALGVLGYIGLYCYSKKKVSFFAASLNMLVVFLAGMFRLNGLLLTLPFFILTLLVRWFKIRKENKKIILRLSLIVLFVLLCCGCNKAIDSFVSSSNTYNASTQYNIERAKLFDYANCNYDEISLEMKKLNISQNDFISIRRMILADTDIVTAEYMENIKNVSKYDFLDKINDFDSNLSNVSDVLLTNNVLFLQCLAFIFLLLLLILFTNCSATYICELLLSCLGTILIILYFSFSGRIPDRVIQSIFIGNWYVYTSVFLNNEFKWKFRTERLFGLLCGLIIACFAIMSNSTNKNPSAVISRFTANNCTKDPIISVDNKYIWNVFCYGEYTKNNFKINNKLPSVEFMNHNIHDGGWTYGQVYYKDYLNSIELSNPMKSLLDDNVYYVSDKERCDMVLTFLREHYDNGVTVQIVDTIDDIPVWEFSKE